MSSSCPICANESCERLPQRVRHTNDVQLYECPHCSLQFLNIWDDADLVRSFYDNLGVVYTSDIRPGLLKYNEYERRLAEIRPYLKPNTRLLEIGAGQGVFLNRVRSYVGEAHACEISPPHIKVLRDMGFHVWDDVLTNIEPTIQYDVVCMYALIEHIPKVGEFLVHLRRWLSNEAIVFIETPNLMDPLVCFYDVPAYRDFFYRAYHLYTFSDRALRLLLCKTGYECETWPIQVASITNHFHWLHTGTKQRSMNDMVNVVLPRPLRRRQIPSGEDFYALLDALDDSYREMLEQAGIGDILMSKAWPVES